MNFAKRNFILGLLLLSAPARSATVADWNHDLDLLVRDVATVDPGAFVKTPQRVFLASVAKLKADLPRLTEEQRMVRAMQIVGAIGDSHTQLDPDNPAFAYWYPFRLYQFTDGYYITAAFKTDADLAGAQVLEIAHKPIDAVIDATRALRGKDTQFAAMEETFVVSSPPLMNGLGFAEPDGSLWIKAKLRNGEIVERRLQPRKADDPKYTDDAATFDWHFRAEMGGPPIGTEADWISVYNGKTYADFRTTDFSRPLRLMNRRLPVAKALADKSAYYIQLSFIGDVQNGDTMDQFFRKALAEVDQMRPKSLIIDVRYNFGGDGSRNIPMIHEFIKREDNPPWKNLYIITGRRTLSAAVMFIAHFQAHVPCSFIGEPAEAPLNHYGDATDVRFIRIGARLSLSTLYHKLDDTADASPFFPLAVPAPMSLADYASGRDPAVDPILAGEEMRSIPLIAMQDGGAAARAAWQARKAKFPAYVSWMIPREVDMIHAFNVLDDAKKPQDALAVAKLDVEMHPQSAAAWGKLGDAQIETGNKNDGLNDGLRSYQRALHLDPNNLSNLDERKALSDARLPATE